MLSLVFPRACIGCDRDDLLLCEPCARNAGTSSTIRLGNLEVRSCLPYSGILRTAINDFKAGRRAFAADLAALLVPFVRSGMTLVPIPTTRRRRAQRGFDQTVLLARILARRSGVEIAELLARRGAGAQQGRSRLERLAASGRFFAQNPAAASGAALFLFDDVRTTGATLIDAARTLEAAGLELRGALTLAWAPKENQ